MARIVVSTAPITDAKPFTAHPQATYSRGCLVVAATAPSPKGMNVPRQMPSGASTTNATTTRAPIGRPSSALVSGVEAEQVEERRARRCPEQRLHAARPAGPGSRPLSSAPTPVKIRIDASVTVREYVG